MALPNSPDQNRLELSADVTVPQFLSLQEWYFVLVQVNPNKESGPLLCDVEFSRVIAISDCSIPVIA